MGPEELQTRDRILNTAFSLFLKTGYENTPVQAIIDAVGIAKGTFYHHFKGKEEMLVALMEGMSRRVVEAVEPVVNDPTLTGLQKMLAASHRGVARKVEDFGPESLLLAQQMRSKSNRLLADCIKDILFRWIRPLYAKVVRQGMEEGVFRVSNPEIATDLVLGLILSMEDQVLDRFVAAAQGDSEAVDRLIELYAAIEQGIERVLGAPEGSLPIYTSTDIRGLMRRYIESLKGSEEVISGGKQ